MALTITHPFVTLAADGPDATKLRPSNWNATHTIAGVLPAANVDLSGVVAITRQVNGHELSADVTVTKADVGLSLVENTALSTGNAATATLAAAALVLATPRSIYGNAFDGSAALAQVIAPGFGGTGLGSYAVGDLLYASGAAALSKLADVAVGSVLVSGGVTTAPAWSASPTLTNLTATSLITQGGALALGTTVTDGIVLQNTTAATVGVPVQNSPGVRVRANVWDTTGVVSRTVDWWMVAVPTTGSQGITQGGFLKLATSWNGGATTFPISFGQNGTIVAIAAITGTGFFAATGGAYGWATRSAITAPANGQFNFMDAGQAVGFGFDALTDGVCRVRTRAQTANAAIWSGADAIAVTSTDGHVLANDTPSTAGVPVQQSPRLRFRSHVWNTTVTAVDNTNDWIIEGVPVSGAVPSGLLSFVSSLNGSTATPMTLASNGVITLSSGTALGSSLTFPATGVLVWTGRARSNSPADAQLNLTNNVNNIGVGLDFATDAILKIRTRAQTGDGDLTAGTITANGALVSAGSTSTAAGAAFRFTGRSAFTSPADGQLNITTTAITVGAGLDVNTDGVLKVRTRAQSAYATVDALGYSVGGVAGASKGAGAVASITVVNGIVTAIS